MSELKTISKHNLPPLDNVAKLFIPAETPDPKKAYPVSMFKGYAFISDGRRLMRLPADLLTGPHYPVKPLGNYLRIIKQCYSRHPIGERGRIDCAELEAVARHLPIEAGDNFGQCVRIGQNLFTPSDVRALAHVAHYTRVKHAYIIGDYNGLLALFEVGPAQLVFSPVIGIDAAAISRVPAPEIKTEREKITL